MSPAISLENIRLRHGRQEVLAGLSLHIDPGETVVLVGPSGSGKSTVLRVILGLVSPDGDTVRLGDETVTEGRRILVPPERRGLAVVFQDLALWPHLTVKAHLAFGLDVRKIPRDVRAVRIRTMLERVGLDDKAGRFPGELYGGERQRVAIARALVHQPRAVLLDEPLTNLDIVLRADLVALLGTLFAEREMTALYVTHDSREAAAFDARIAVLEGGRIVADGLPAELAAPPPTPFVRALFDESTRGPYEPPGGEMKLLTLRSLRQVVKAAPFRVRGTSLLFSARPPSAIVLGCGSPQPHVSVHLELALGLTLANRGVAWPRRPTSSLCLPRALRPAC